MRKILLSTYAVLTVCLYAQTDCQDTLVLAYKNNNMNVWADYLSSTCFDNITPTQKIEYLNYEYGYLAVCIDREKEETKSLLSLFEKHISQLDSILPLSDLLAYKSAFYAYDLKIHKSHLLRSARKALKLSEQALETDSLSFMALTMNANLLFYRPRWLGGNKKKAYHYLLTAKQQAEKQGNTCTWNYLHCLQMISLCEQKYQIQLSK